MGNIHKIAIGSVLIFFLVASFVSALPGIAGPLSPYDIGAKCYKTAQSKHLAQSCADWCKWQYDNRKGISWNGTDYKNCLNGAKGQPQIDGQEGANNL